MAMINDGLAEGEVHLISDSLWAKLLFTEQIR